MDHHYHRVKWGPRGTRVKTGESYWRQPLKWNREAKQAGVRRRVFCASLADVFEEWPGSILCYDGEKDERGKPVPVVAWWRADAGVIRPGQCKLIEGERPATMDDLRRDLFKLIDRTPWLDWLLLTKRPENIRRMWDQRFNVGCDHEQDQTCGRCMYRGNVWLLTSVAVQADAERNVPELLKCRELSPVLGLSAEPLLGPIRLDHIDVDASSEWCQINALTGRHTDMGRPCPDVPHLDWVIAGGESGQHARPMSPSWAYALRDQCIAAGVPYFYKQWGEWAPLEICAQPDASWSACGYEKIKIVPEDEMVFRIGKKAAGRFLPACEMGELQEWSQFPKVEAMA